MIIGIDEVGRGPLAGPVMVTLCLLYNDEGLLDLFPKKILRDSKKLSEKARERIYSELLLFQKQGRVDWLTLSREATDIDSRGIAVVIRECIEEGLAKLRETKGEGVLATKIYCDGSLFTPKEYTNTETIIKGDEKILAISLASIIAKVTRDTLMTAYDNEYPGYGFASHKGYGTKKHCDAIVQHGLTPLHRKSFCKRRAGP